MFKRFILISTTILVLALPESVLAQRYYRRRPPPVYRGQIIPCYPSRIIYVPVYPPPPPPVPVIRRYPSYYRPRPVMPRRAVREYARECYPEMVRTSNTAKREYYYPESRTRYNGSRSTESELIRIDAMEKEIAEMKRTLNGLSEKFDRYLKGFPSSKEYQEYRKDLEKLGQLKRELQELKRTLNQLRGYRY